MAEGATTVTVVVTVVATGEVFVVGSAEMVIVVDTSGSVEMEAVVVKTVDVPVMVERAIVCFALVVADTVLVVVVMASIR